MKKSKIEGRLEVQNKVDDTETVTLYLYGDIGNNEWWYDVSLHGIRRALQGKEFSNLEIHVNSNGGDVFESIAIANYLKNLDAEVTIIIESMAASGMSIIAMAGDKVFIRDNAMLMIHNAWTVAMGNADELRKVADDLDKIGTSFSKTYMGRFVGTEDELKVLLDEETLLTAEEALQLGLVDEIKNFSGSEDLVQGKVVEDAKNEILNKYAGTEKVTTEKESNVFNNLLNTLTGGI